MKALTRNSGLSVIELLVVMAVLGIVLSVLLAFFNMQVQTTSRTQAASEVEVRVRSAAEMIMQDLQMAGSRLVVDSTGTVPVVQYVDDIVYHCSPLLTSPVHCASVTEAGQLTLFYASSLRQNSQPCRRVDYRLDETTLTLLRSEVGCSADALVNNSDLQPFALQVEEFRVEFTCADGTDTGEVEGGTGEKRITDPLSCYTIGSFPHQATVFLTAVSENRRENRSAAVQLTTTMPNMRPVAVSE